MDTPPHRRILVLTVGVALALAVAFALPSVTTAAPPEPVDERFVVRGECDFPVQVEIRGKEKFVELPGGRTLVTSPGLRATLTNLEEPTNQATVGITGAVRVRETASGDLVFVWTGRNLFWGPDTDFVLTVGRFTGRISASGEFSPITGKGRVIDICARLS